MTLHDLDLTLLCAEETGGVETGAVKLLIREIHRLVAENQSLYVELARLRGEPVQTLAEALAEVSHGYVHIGPLPDPALPF